MYISLTGNKDNKDVYIKRSYVITQSLKKMRKEDRETALNPVRFIKTTSVTKDGEIAEKKVCELDFYKIREKEQYDVFYSVITNLEGDISGILKINRQRWEIEESFRIMKTDLEARPVYVRREDRIRAHFLTCYISLLVYRLLEKKIGNKYTCNEILSILRSMQVTLLSKESGYGPHNYWVCSRFLLSQVSNSGVYHSFYMSIKWGYVIN